MKKLIIAGIVMTLFLLGCAIVSAEEPTHEGIFAKFAVGQDNAYLCNGSKCFLAIGGGIDILGYQKAIGQKGSILDLKLHTMALAKVSDNETGTVFGAAITLDAMKLITGTGINVLIPNLNVLIGPAAGYDVTTGKPVYGGMINFNYQF